MDWLFKTDEGIFHVRVAGILVVDGKLLIQRDASGACAIPGGHLRFGETTTEALAREFREELDMDIICDRLLWTEENFWRWGGTDAHNLCYYYLVSLPVGAALPEPGALMKDNSSIVFDWLPVGELDGVEIYPEFLKTELSQLDGPPKHFVRGK